MRGQVVHYFGYVNGKMNYGLEISNSAGTNIVAPGEGVVVYCAERGAYGFVVDIDHGNGFVSRLTHLADVQVELNQRVFIGDTVTAKLVLTEKDEPRNTCVFAATVTNQSGTVVAEGTTFLKVL